MRARTILLLLWAMQLLADPAHPPLVPEGEPVADVLEVVNDAFPRSGVNTVAFSPDGHPPGLRLA